MNKILFPLLILTALIVSMSPSPAYACSCVFPYPSSQESLEASDAVFLGKVTNSEIIPRGEEEFRGDDDVRVRFDVSEVWKGPASQTLVVVTPLEGSLCGLGSTFMIGEEYLVYAYTFEEGNELWAGLCSRTAHISNAQDDLVELNRLGDRQSEDLDPIPQIEEDFEEDERVSEQRLDDMVIEFEEELLRTREDLDQTKRDLENEEKERELIGGELAGTRNALEESRVGFENLNTQLRLFTVVSVVLAISTAILAVLFLKSRAKA